MSMWRIVATVLQMRLYVKMTNLSDIDVALHDRVVDGLVDTARVHTQERRLEESLRATESFVTDGDDLSIRQFVGLLEGGGGSGGGHFLFEVQGNIAELLLDISDNFSLSCRLQIIRKLVRVAQEVLACMTVCPSPMIFSMTYQWW